MRILFVVHHDFFSEREAELKWLDQYEQALLRLGHVVTRFNAETDKIREHDIVHIFANKDPELWVTISGMNPRTVLTPSLRAQVQEKTLQQKLVKTLVRVVRSASQRRWPPRDKETWCGQMKAYLVPDQAWADLATNDWGVARQRLHVMPIDHEEAAKIGSAVYEKCYTNA